MTMRRSCRWYSPAVAISALSALLGGCSGSGGGGEGGGSGAAGSSAQPTIQPAASTPQTAPAKDEDKVRLPPDDAPGRDPLDKPGERP